MIKRIKKYLNLRRESNIEKTILKYLIKKINYSKYVDIGDLIIRKNMDLQQVKACLFALQDKKYLDQESGVTSLYIENKKIYKGNEIAKYGVMILVDGKEYYDRQYGINKTLAKYNTIWFIPSVIITFVLACNTVLTTKAKEDSLIKIGKQKERIDSLEKAMQHIVFNLQKQDSDSINKCSETEHK